MGTVAANNLSYHWPSELWVCSGIGQCYAEGGSRFASCAWFVDLSCPGEFDMGSTGVKAVPYIHSWHAGFMGNQQLSLEKAFSRLVVSE
jgi:hypothetical protein